MAAAISLAEIWCGSRTTSNFKSAITTAVLWVQDIRQNAFILAGLNTCANLSIEDFAFFAACWIASAETCLWVEEISLLTLSLVLARLAFATRLVPKSSTRTFLN